MKEQDIKQPEGKDITVMDLIVYLQQFPLTAKVVTDYDGSLTNIYRISFDGDGVVVIE